MEKSLFIALALVLMANLSKAQTIYRCNNDPSVTLSPNMFRTLQAAHDAATAGDIIYVEPSYNSTSYGGLVCTKTLRIIGNGYNHSAGTSVNQPWQQVRSLIGDAITIEKTAPNTVLEGLNYSLSNTLNIRALNVTITRCIYEGNGATITLLRDATGNNGSGAKFTKNLGLPSIQTNGYSTYNAPTCSYTAFQIENITISNNLMKLNQFGLGINSGSTSLLSGGSCTSPSVNIPPIKNLICSNNTFMSGLGINSCQNCTVQNNILRNGLGTGLNGNGNVAANNVCTTGCDFGSNNVENVLLSNIFIIANPNNIDQDYRLSLTSPAISAGVGGIDAGAFGTTDPYRISGLAPIPQITSYSKNASSGVYTTTTPMTVTISVRGNN